MKGPSRALFAAVSALLFTTALYGAERTVTIKSARSTVYSGTKESDGSETVRFIGDVTILVSEGSTTSTISADEIVYNKTRETLEAHGSVRFERKTGASGGQLFTGEALLFNIKDQEGEFLGGKITQDSGKKDGDPYIVHAEIAGRDSGATMAFKNGVLTTCDEPDPHWSIKASRIWLLPGNEIALFNGIFFIGPLPILYIPAFYYPSDEMIVNPVFGVRNRQGAFVQTTTYLLGRKPLKKTSAADKSNFTNFLQSDTLKEQRREGLFFRNLETDAKNQGTDYVKLMVDAYSGLGAMAGLEGNLSPQDTFLRNFSFSVLAGMSRTLFPPLEGISYSPYDSQGREYWDSSSFFGVSLPFRFRSDLSLKINQASLSLDIALPLISDPYFKQDFLDRSEDLNWFDYILNQDTLALGSSISTETSYSWKVNGSFNPKITYLKPWIDTLNVTKLSGTVLLSSKANEGLTRANAAYSPERTFYYPQKINPELSLTIGGTLLSSEDRTNPTTQSSSVGEGVIQNPFKPEIGEETGESREDAVNGSVRDAFPALSNQIPAQNANESTWSLTWLYQPSVLEEITYDSTDWHEPSDVDWNSYASVFNRLKNDLDLTGKYDMGKIVKLSSTVKFSSTLQDHPWMSDSVNTPLQQDTAKLNDYKSSVWLVTSTEQASLSPFSASSLFSPSSLSWNLSGTLAKSSFNGTAEDPSWKTELFEWDKTYVTNHYASATAGFNLADNVQSLKITSYLDPLLQSYKGELSLGWAPLSVTGSTRLFEKDTGGRKWYWDPFVSTVKIGLPFSSSLSQGFTYNIQEEEPSSLSYNLNTPYVSADYRFSSAIPYELIPGSGWVLKGTKKEFIPTSTSLTVSNTKKQLALGGWKNRINLLFSVSSTVKLDLLKITDSSLTFTPSITFKIHEFLDLTFSSSSENGVIARYFQDYANLPVRLPGETNPLIDLADSFMFWDTPRRTASGYKLTNLSLTAIHNLHDWTATFSTTVRPELITDTAKPYYDFKPVISLTVQWKPVTDIKTSVKSEKGVFTLNTTSSDSASTP